MSFGRFKKNDTDENTQKDGKLIGAALKFIMNDHGGPGKFNYDGVAYDNNTPYNSGFDRPVWDLGALRAGETADKVEINGVLENADARRDGYHGETGNTGALTDLRVHGRGIFDDSLVIGGGNLGDGVRPAEGVTNMAFRIKFVSSTDPDNIMPDGQKRSYIEFLDAHDPSKKYAQFFAQFDG